MAIQGLVLTLAGAAEIEAAYQAGEVINITDFVFGDGGGAAVSEDPAELAKATALAGQFGAEPFTGTGDMTGIISGDAIIDCGKYPGKMLREIGWVSDRGTLVAYGGYPESLLPAQVDSIIKEFVITSLLVLDHASTVTIVYDPDRAVLTREVADTLYVPLPRTVNGHALKEDITLSAADVSAWSKTESDERFQPKGDYAAAGSSYTKDESDTRFQPKGDYAAAGSAYTKDESDTRFQPKGNYAAAGSAYTKDESDNKYQPKGDYLTASSGVQNVQLGAQVQSGGDTPAGCVVTYVDGGENVSFIKYKPVQIYINGGWRTISG